jgi:polyvinyl alcohol dehydrogenase (cytochrome)
MRVPLIHIPVEQAVGWLLLLLLACLVGCSQAPATDPATENAADIGTADAAPHRQATELDGAALYADNCAACHEDAEQNRAQPLENLALMDPAQIAFAMSNGIMQSQAEDLSIGEQLQITTFIAGERVAWSADPAAYCAAVSAAAETPEMDLTPRFSRWAVDADATATLPEGASSIRADNIGSLELAWVFGLPNVANARSQPVLSEDTLFVAATSGHLFALDRLTGCIHWHRALPAPPRTALTLGEVNGTTALFFGDMEAHVNAVSARDGVTLWRHDASIAEHTMLTGAIIQHDQRLIVPASLYETGLASNPDYECCVSHGGVIALSAATGERLWTTPMTEPATSQGETKNGTRSWGPSGVPVWSTPTIDAERGLIYVGTGQNASLPATAYSDSVVALRLDSGEIDWHFQAIAGDAYNLACDQNPPGPNCPKWRGPDHDIGAAVVIARDSEGRTRLIVGQKSGDVYALDPDQRGALLWQQRVGAGSALGGIHWGLAVADGVVFAPVADPPFPLPQYRPAPGLYALSVDDGELLWASPVSRDCETNLYEYFGRADLYPECSFYFGLSAPPLVANDLVFAPALDGRLRAFSRASGEVVWATNTYQAFETVNGVPAHGGSMDVAGVQAADDMLYLQSGYGQFGQLPGNALLAYRLR